MNKLSKTMLRRTERLIAKEVSEEHLLRRKLPRHVLRIIRKHHDLGKVMEEFIHDDLVGADAWRRTGVLTFDGDRKRGKQVTYK